MRFFVFALLGLVACDNIEVDFGSSEPASEADPFGVPTPHPAHAPLAAVEVGELAADEDLPVEEDPPVEVVEEDEGPIVTQTWDNGRGRSRTPPPSRR
jgi:hypothetical protein